MRVVRHFESQLLSDSVVHSTSRRFYIGTIQIQFLAHNTSFRFAPTLHSFFRQRRSEIERPILQHIIETAANLRRRESLRYRAAVVRGAASREHGFNAL